MRTKRAAAASRLGALVVSVVTSMVLVHAMCAFMIGIVLVLGWSAVVFVAAFSLKRTLLGLAVLALSVPGGFVAMLAQDALGARSADRIVAAIDEYKADNGRFPVRMSELMPRYLSAIPRATVGLASKYPYYVSDGTTGYRLAYGGQDCGVRRGFNSPGYGSNTGAPASSGLCLAPSWLRTDFAGHRTALVPIGVSIEPQLAAGSTQPSAQTAR